MREYGLIGYPLSHSFSQKYFTQKFEKEAIADAVFHAFAIPSIEELPQLLKDHPQLVGFCITIPYKRSVMQYLNEASDAVKQMDACNCVRITNGKLYGFNTDVVGFEKSFIKHLQPHHTHALILGTGGASSAVEFVLKKLNIAYHFVSRTKDESKNILGYTDVNEALLATHSVIINCTPLGTYPNVDAAPQLPYHLLNASHYLFDLVYNPPKTKFLLLGEQQGATMENGSEMLALQAEENWIIWNS
ncbi:MAG TPA: shikimate dehydrogenase [Panacibacter sp.]|nr:shikimate dehydrogenase [Panacibacter sp.]